MPVTVCIGKSLLFPAWAGVILALSGQKRKRKTFPRMGGGDP